MQINEKEIITIVTEVIRSLETDNDKDNFSTFKHKSLNNSNILKEKLNYEIKDQLYIDRAIKKTPARIGIGRVGYRYKTSDYLKFLADHAAAVDAVYSDVSDKFINNLNIASLKSMAPDKEKFIINPMLGRKLSKESSNFLIEHIKNKPKIIILLIDGLSSTAIETNGEELLKKLYNRLKTMSRINSLTDIAFFIRNGRVAITDDIGEMLKPELIISIIGERPGLVTAESLSAYITYKPRINTTEADRNLISNIHKNGTTIEQAVDKIVEIIKKIFDQKLSGVKLKL